MYPDLKFMNSNDDIIFAPLENNEINSGFFIPEEFIEEFRTSCISENPLKFDFRETLLNSNIENKEEELKELIESYENDSTILRNDLPSYNIDTLSSFENSRSIPLECEILRDLDLDIDEEVLELSKDFDDTYTLESRYPNKCNPDVIFNNIIASNPRIMGVFTAYRIPYPVARKVLLQVISSTLSNCNNNSNWFPLPGGPIPINPGYPTPYYGNNKMGDTNDD